MLSLDLGLDGVIALQQGFGLRVTKQAAQLFAYSAVPVDQRAVAVKARPPVLGHEEQHTGGPGFKPEAPAAYS
jgi:hypothetical protein